MAIDATFEAHLSSGTTTLCRCWELIRRDGTRFGFTDHDSDLRFGGRTFAASDGLSARAFSQTTGLSVDNSEALGVISDTGIREEDIAAGRFDGARVSSWLVNWADPRMRALQFRGTLGEIERAGGAFKAELRGLTETLNAPQGLTYQSVCSTILGDERCRVDLSRPAYSTEAAIVAIQAEKIIALGPLDGYAPRWFERGRLVVLSGASKGDVALVKNDRGTGSARRIEIWESLRGGIAAGDRVRIEAGCDRREETCREKFSNMVNFRGFPHLPGEDWLMAYPNSRTIGGSGDG
ncbi:putative phage protein (TIGR02218 family) [Palleronia aestuarii]|uniref:Putative phage protein (TIGR02218 family) n=1 Tax=Palleronia aestuarii TaxID=568105 RepID=A0A2W7NWM6_9RHOB|nr:DUF2163 domain-containing protein [Palleronia aestuarii]PZX17706.1 putative phage protein (TIGR02218 family) [Palleronia aestuarii]